MADVTLPAVGALSSGGGDPRTAAVPAGVVAGSLVIIPLGLNHGGRDPVPPTDFTQFANVASGAGLGNALARLYRKIAAGADSGTYSVPTAISVGEAADIQVLRIANHDPTTPIFDSNANSATTGTTTPAVSVAACPPGTLLLWMLECGAVRTCTPPTDFERVTANASQRLHIAYKGAHSGDSGSITGSISSNGQQAVILAAIQPVPSGNPGVAFLSII